MLPRAHRLRRSAEFAHVVRRGQRATARTLVLHEDVRADSEPVRVGFVVSRSVGNAVVRNRVKRQLRVLTGQRLTALAAHSSLVVRATPAAAGTDAAQLAGDLDACLVRLARRRATAVSNPR